MTLSIKVIFYERRSKKRINRILPIVWEENVGIETYLHLKRAISIIHLQYQKTLILRIKNNCMWHYDLY